MDKWIMDRESLTNILAV